MTGNAGEGEIGVSASIGDVWSAIVTEPWITIVTGYDAGTGSGTVRFTYTDNDTGRTRTGKIIVAGEVYTLTQAARVLVAVTADVAGGGFVSGAGSYTLGEKATLEAIPKDGYEFLYWTGDAGETMENPLVVTADVAKRVTAHFAPLTPEFTSAIVHSPIAYENLRGATHANPATYAEGTALAFSAPGAVTGYTFTGWTPASITAEMTGAQTVRANWRANAYRIVYSAGGGAGETAPTDCAYDADAAVAESAFVREGYVFRGWATEEGGEVVYAPGAAVRNLTFNDGGVVTLYAVWEAEAVEAPVISPVDGMVFRTASCTVTITCATKGATVYCSTNGRTPRPTEANRYTGPFEVTGTTTVIAYAVKGERESELAEATLVYVEPEPLTLANALDERKLTGIATGGDAAWTPVADAAAKVTVEVPPTVKTVKAPTGAKVRVMRDGHDITGFLDIPKADASGVVDLASAAVKDEIVQETLDIEKGAEIRLDDTSKPSLKTAPTKPGLVYTLREGATLDAMKDGDSTVGDGAAWTPAVTVKGGASGFYSIRVSK